MKFVKTAVFALGLFFLTQLPALAQDAPVTADDVATAPVVRAMDTRAIGAGLVIIGTGLGIGWIGAFAVSGIARQPEVAGNIQTAMIIAAALIEGVAFFALIIIMLFLSGT